jgi:beta-lactamase regulating signal transducer with metallopeptidase domain
MGIGTSILLITVGAILKYAVNADISGLELDTVGTILLIVGILGLVLSLVYTFFLADRRRGTVVDEPVPPPRDRMGPPRY